MKFFEDTFEILNKPFNIFLLLLSEGFKEYNNNKYSVNSDKFEPNEIQTRFLKIVEDLKNIVLNQNTYNLKQLKTILNKKVDEYFKLIDLRIILKNLLLKLYKIRDLNFKNDENEFNKNPLKFYNDIYKDINNDEVLKLSNKIIKPIYNIIKDIIIKDEDKKDKELKKEKEEEKIKSIELDKDIYNDTDLNKLKEDIFKKNIVYSKEDLLKLQKLEKLFKEYKNIRDGYYQQTIYINKKFYKDKLDKIKQEITDYISKLKDVDEINTIYLKLLNSKSIIENLYDNITEKRKNKNFSSWIKDYTYYVNLYLKLPLFYRDKIDKKFKNKIDPSLIDYSKFVTNIKTKELYNRIIFYIDYFYWDNKRQNTTTEITKKLKTFGINLNYDTMKKLTQEEIKQKLFSDYNVDMSYINTLIDEIIERYGKLKNYVDNYDDLVKKEQEQAEAEEAERLKKEEEADDIVQDKTGQPGEQPGEQTGQPGEQPGEQPGQPGEQPGQPGEQPGQPGEDTTPIQEVQHDGLFKTKSNIDKKNININRIILKKQREKELKTIRILKRQNKINQIISNFMKQQQNNINEEENKEGKEGGALFDKNLLNKYINRIS
jgi:hypothetical protein